MLAFKNLKRKNVNDYLCDAEVDKNLCRHNTSSFNTVNFCQMRAKLFAIYTKKYSTI